MDSKENESEFLRFSRGEITFEEYFASLPKEIQEHYRKKSKEDFWHTPVTELGWDI